MKRWWCWWWLAIKLGFFVWLSINSFMSIAIAIAQYRLTIYASSSCNACALTFQLHFNFNGVIDELWICIKIQIQSLAFSRCVFVIFVELFRGFDSVFFLLISVFSLGEFVFSPSSFMVNVKRMRRRKPKNDCCVMIQSHCYDARRRAEDKWEVPRWRVNEWIELIGHWEFRRYSFTFFSSSQTRSTFIWMRLCVCLFHCPFSTRALFLIDLVKVSSMPANCALLSYVYARARARVRTLFLLCPRCPMPVAHIFDCYYAKNHICAHNGIKHINLYVYFTFGEKNSYCQAGKYIHESHSIPLIQLLLKESTLRTTTATMMMMINVARMMSEQKWYVH